MSTSRTNARCSLILIAGLAATAVVLFVGLVALVAAGRAVAGSTLVPRKTLLELDLTTPPAEHAVLDDLSALLMGPERLSVRDIVDALDRAADDRRVTGLVVTVGGDGGGMAVIQELRQAMERFREAGKPVVAFAETFGEAGPGNGGYYLVSDADHIVLQPSGDVGLVGLVWQAQFLKDALHKLEIQPQLDQRWEYKSAMNQFTERSFTDAHREATESVLNSQQRQLVQGIAAGRDMSERQVLDLLDRGPFVAQEALEAGLVDQLGYRDEAYEKARLLAGDADLLYVGRYLERRGRPHQRGPKVALIYGVGSVVRGSSSYDPLLGTQTMGSDTVAAAFRAAVADGSVRAIVFRIDSPGGSYVASDTIWREVERARAAGKPVIATMGNVAGSGGYFVAMAADRIVAQPGTVTGSIGVLGGKLVVRDFLANKLGITVDDVAVSEHARMYLSTSPYSADEWQRHQVWLDRVYADFTSKVATGRDMEVDEVRRVARGRIWTGQDAHDLGLVDALGGYAEAIALAKEAMGLEPEEDVRLTLFPKPRPWWAQLVATAPESGEPVGTARSMARVLDAARPWLEVAGQAGLLDDDRHALSMPVTPPLP